MKAIILSVKPKCVEKILNCEKTVEVRKVAPKIEEPFKVYIYCTKAKDKEDKQAINTNWSFVRGCEQKIVGEFICEKVLKYECSSEGFGELATTCGTCLTYDDILNYCSGQDLYGLHISQLKIYGKPKELSEFDYGCPFNVTYCDSGKCKYQKATTVCSKINKKVVAPKNYCYAVDLGEQNGKPSSLHERNLLKKTVEKKFNDGTLFTNASYNNYLKKCSEDELKKHITVYVLYGANDYKGDFGEEHNKKLFVLKSSIFKNIIVLASNLVVNSFVAFSDGRVDQTNYTVFFKDLWSNVNSK